MSCCSRPLFVLLVRGFVFLWFACVVALVGAVCLLPGRLWQAMFLIVALCEGRLSSCAVVCLVLSRVRGARQCRWSRCRVWSVVQPVFPLLFSCASVLFEPLLSLSAAVQSVVALCGAAVPDFCPLSACPPFCSLPPPVPFPSPWALVCVCVTSPLPPCRSPLLPLAS